MVRPKWGPSLRRGIIHRQQKMWNIRYDKPTNRCGVHGTCDLLRVLPRLSETFDITPPVVRDYSSV